MADSLIETSAEPIDFGSTDKWTFDPTTKIFDLSRSSAKQLTIPTDDGLSLHKAVTIDPQKTALVIVDMQNFFLHPDCRENPLGLAAVAPLTRVIEKSRTEGIQVVWLNWGLTDDDALTMPPSLQRGFGRDLIAGTNTGYRGLGADLGNGKGRCLFAGSWNADIYPPLKSVVADDDVHCSKNRMSGLWSPAQPLLKYLLESGKQTILFAGVNTDQCVLGTLTDAYSWGWDCLLVGDCAATTTGQGAKDVCEHNVANSYGFVIDSEQLQRATASP
ncbi:MAG: hypothetical protein M1819_004643 [Sarea resinae]|nr:MAG: hypothetical protein M1819_004643 [Sarea resinae]